MSEWMTKAKRDNSIKQIKEPTTKIKKAHIYFEKGRSEITRKRMRDSKIKLSTNKQDKNSFLPLSF